MISRHKNSGQAMQDRGSSDIKLAASSAKALREKADGKNKRRTVIDSFHLFARKTSEMVGHPWSFIIALLIIAGWAALGPLFGYSDTWQLVINTATTIITFLMVFLIQNTQNRDARAIHLKLDELLHAAKGARNRLISLEELSDEELNALQKEFERVRKKAPPEKCEDKAEQPV
jgi:low affinity Fe/Cu permease